MALGFIVAIAFVVRFWGIEFGLPCQGARPEEELVVSTVTSIAWMHDLNPHHFSYGGVFYYLAAAIVVVGVKLALLLGILHAPEQFSTLIHRDASCLFLTVRTISVLAGVATVLTVFYLARRCSTVEVGLAAAFLLALNYGHVRECHNGKPDALATLLSTLTLVYCINIARNGLTRDYALAGVMTGLAGGTKINYGAVAIAVIVAHCLSPSHRRPKLLMMSAAVAAVIFAVTNPFIFIDLSAYRTNMGNAAANFSEFENTYFMSPVNGPVIVEYLAKQLPMGMGLPCFLAALAGFLIALGTRPPWGIVLSSAAIALMLPISIVQFAYIRYLLPLYPVLAVFAADTAVRVCNIPRVRARHRGPAVAIALALLSAPSVLNVVQFDALMCKTDTRVQAYRWLLSNVPAGASVFLQSGFGGIDVRPAALPYKVTDLDVAAAGVADEIEKSRPDVVCLSEYHFFRNLNMIPPRLIGPLKRDYHLIFVANPYAGQADESAWFDRDAYYAPYVGMSVVARPGPLVLIFGRNEVWRGKNWLSTTGGLLKRFSQLQTIARLSACHSRRSPSKLALMTGGTILQHILITGGLGFAGSHLADRLLHDGHRVTIVDSCISNVMEPRDYEGRCEVITQPIEFLRDRLMPAQGRVFDRIYHLASVVGPAGVLKHAGNIARSTVLASDTTVELALAHGARLSLTSTSEVYGQAGACDEHDAMVVPSDYTIRLEYAVAKLTTEVSALNRARVSELWVNVVRPFNISGPRQLPAGGFVLPRFVIAALKNEPLTVFGDGRQVRAFTDVRDIVEGIVCVMESDCRGEIFNLGNRRNETTIEDLAHRVVRLTESASSIVHVDPKTIFGPLYAEAFDKVPNAVKAMERLGWQPRTDLDTTILETIEWYRGRPDLVACQQVVAGAVGSGG